MYVIMQYALCTTPASNLYFIFDSSTHYSCTASILWFGFCLDHSWLTTRTFHIVYIDNTNQEVSTNDLENVCMNFCYPASKEGTDKLQ